MVGSIKKAKRNREIKRLHDRGWSFTKIGKFYGMSRARAHQIYHNKGSGNGLLRVGEVIWNGKVKRILRSY